jgi:hypothetical protein
LLFFHPLFTYRIVDICVEYVQKHCYSIAI